ncbi:MAG: PAS domain S-box protein [Myxococcales bacterium]|nr:PAS domain S-box protein [Myxococcales bacterium]
MASRTLGHDRDHRSEDRCRELWRYVRWTDEDLGHLRALAEVSRPHFARIADEFYERVREHEDAHAVLRDEAQVLRLKGTLQRWMESLLTAERDEAYCEDRARIGRVHVRVGLPQRFVPAAMALIHGSLVRLAEPLAHAERIRSALTRAIDVDLAMMLETYVEDFVARLEHIQSTESMQLREALEREVRMRADALERVEQVIVGVDPSGVVLFANKASETVTGFGRDLLEGGLFVERFAQPAGRDELRVVVERARFEQSGIEWTGTLETRAGHGRLVRWRFVPSADGAIMLATGEDVTDEQSELERKIRTERLAGVGTLAAGLAHEIRNPLNGALLHVTFLERALARRDAAENEREAVRAVGDEIRRLSALVRDFLVFARPSPPTLKPNNLNALCLRTLTIFEGDARVAGVSVQQDLAPDDPIVNSDSDKLQQVLLNLLRNAAEAVSSKKGTVTLRTRRRPRHASIEIEDDGPGLPSPEAPIFDAFYSTKPNGTGLGLAIVHRIVADHGGSVEVESAPGRTLFRVLLPATWG